MISVVNSVPTLPATSPGFALRASVMDLMGLGNEIGLAGNLKPGMRPMRPEYLAWLGRRRRVRGSVANNKNSARSPEYLAAGRVSRPAPENGAATVAHPPFLSQRVCDDHTSNMANLSATSRFALRSFKTGRFCHASREQNRRGRGGGGRLDRRAHCVRWPRYSSSTTWPSTSDTRRSIRPASSMLWVAISIATLVALTSCISAPNT